MYDSHTQDEIYYTVFRKIVKNKRLNRRAWLFNYVAKLEYGLTLQQACKFWVSLDEELKAKVNEYLDYRINVAIEDLEVE